MAIVVFLQKKNTIQSPIGQMSTLKLTTIAKIHLVGAAVARAELHAGSRYRRPFRQHWAFERRGRGTSARVFPALQFCERWFDEENAVEKNLCCYFCFCYGCLLKSTICYCCSALTCLLRKMLSCGATKSYLWSRYDKINLEATIATFFSLSYYLYRFHESYFWNNKKNEDFNEV